MRALSARGNRLYRFSNESSGSLIDSERTLCSALGSGSSHSDSSVFEDSPYLGNNLRKVKSTMSGRKWYCRLQTFLSNLLSLNAKQDKAALPTFVAPSLMEPHRQSSSQMDSQTASLTTQSDMISTQIRRLRKLKEIIKVTMLRN